MGVAYTDPVPLCINHSDTYHPVKDKEWDKIFDFNQNYWASSTQNAEKVGQSEEKEELQEI